MIFHSNQIAYAITNSWYWFSICITFFLRPLKVIVFYWQLYSINSSCHHSTIPGHQWSHLFFLIHIVRESARQRYCGDNPDAFPLALVCFYDKTNTDVFGSCSCSPLVCTPSFLNKDCCNHDSNYMVLAYSKSWIWERKSKKTDSSDEITGWTQLSVINHQSNYQNSWRRKFLDWSDGTACVCEAMDTLYCWWHLRTQQYCGTHEWRTA